MPPTKPLCQALERSCSISGPGKPCLNPATQGKYCYAHDPNSVPGGEYWAVCKAEGKPASPLCTGIKYSHKRGEAGTPCTRAATRGPYCYSHDPEVIAERENKAHLAALGRKRDKELLERKLVLIPVLDAVKKARKRVDCDWQRQGMTITVGILEELIREVD